MYTEEAKGFPVQYRKAVVKLVMTRERAVEEAEERRAVTSPVSKFKDCNREALKVRAMDTTATVAVDSVLLYVFTVVVFPQMVVIVEGVVELKEAFDEVVWRSREKYSGG